MAQPASSAYQKSSGRLALSSQKKASNPMTPQTGQEPDRGLSRPSDGSNRLKGVDVLSQRVASASPSPKTSMHIEKQDMREIT